MTIRWALLGPGRHAEKSVVAPLKRADGSALVAVLSRDRARGEDFARKHGITRVFTSFDDLLSDPEIDAIYDATPDGLHARHAIAAARAGKHALIEKPLAISVKECVEAIDACRRHKVTLGVVFNQRHEAVHQEARRVVLQGEIGTIKLATVQIPLQSATPRAALPATNWRMDPEMRPGGIVVSIGDHAYDTLAYMIGQQIESVSAFTDATQSARPNERVAGMLLELSGGAIGYASASYVTPFARRPFEIHGTEGSIIIENSYAYLTGAEQDSVPTLTLINKSGTVTRCFAASDCFRMEIEQFNRAIEGKGRPMTPAEDGLRSLAIRDALYDAITHRRATKVADYLP